MKPIVLDCSVTLSWCFTEEKSGASDALLVYVRKHTAIVPSLWTLELANGFLNATRSKRMSWSEAVDFLELFSKLPVRVVELSARDCLTKVLELAKSHGLSAYDAAYLHLALQEKMPLATFDRSLKRAASSFGLSFDLARASD